MVEGEGKRDLNPLDFSTFILSLASSAQVNLGTIPSPVTGKMERDLILAKQTIDVLEILQNKTKGNLDENEKRLMDNLLYDLRLKYIEVSKK